MPFEWIVAVRFLREGRMQTVLIVGGVAVGVGVIIFLSALINGLQTSLIDRTLGSQAHIVLHPADEQARPVMVDTAVIRTSDKPPQRVRSIEQWQQIMGSLSASPDVTAVSPLVSGSAFAVRGSATKSIAVLGVDPPQYGKIINVSKFIVSGAFRLTGAEAVIGTDLALDLGLSVGDKFRLVAAGDRTETFSISGIFDYGNRDLNRRWVYVSLRSAQTLLDLPGGVSHIDVRVADIFDADRIAVILAAQTGLVADSWMKINRQLMVGLSSQNSSSYMIQFFVIMAVALGIASVLVVWVVQKFREIGILRAMGASARRIQIVFLLQGGIVGLLGSFLGILLGISLALLFQSFAKNPDGSATFPVDLNTALFVRSALIAVGTGLLSAMAPARRAARLDPAEAIRG